MIKIEAQHNVFKSKESKPTAGIWGALGGSRCQKPLPHFTQLDLDHKEKA